MQVKKKIKENPKQDTIPQNIMIKFINCKGQSLGVYQLSTKAGPKHFQQLIQKLLPENDEQFNFFHQTKEIKNQLALYFEQIKYSNFQATFQVIYYPTSNFKVKPITRSTSSMFGHTQAVLSLNFSPDCRQLASGSGDGTLRLWDIHTQTPLHEIKADNWVMIVQWSPDGEKLAYAEKNGNITVYKIDSEIQIKLLGHKKWVTSLAWQPLHINQDCDYLVSGSKDFTVRLWNTNNGVCLRSFGNHTKCVTKVLWSGSDQIYTCSQDQKISCFDGKGQHLRQLKKHSHWVNTMTISTQHVLKRGCFEPGNMDIIKNKKQKALQLYEKAIKNHSERLVTGSDDHTLMLFILPNKTPVKQMFGHQQPINHAQFSPDGRYIISASFDKSIKLWDGYTGQFMFTFRGHVSPVYQISWSSDNRYLVSASKDSTLKVWDIKTRKLMFDLPGHADQIYAVDWSLDGQMVASGGKDRQVKLWKN